jgi:YD repeat-containing protein
MAPIHTTLTSRSARWRRTTKVTDPVGNATAGEYDLAGRQTAAIDYNSAGAELRRRTFGYDPAGNRTTETTPEGHTTTRAYDAADRMTSLTEPVSASANILTTFGYDAAGERTRMTDGRGNSTVTAYNSLGLPESVIEPSTAAYPNAADRTWTRSYDAVGNPVTDAEPGGVKVTRTFDELDRLTKKTGTGAQVPPPIRPSAMTWPDAAPGCPRPAATSSPPTTTAVCP